jgi:predicted ATPase
MSEPTFVRDLFEIPDQIRKGDFVHKLTEGIEDPAATATSYVVTPALADAFDRALRLVGSALRDGRSQAAYLHGSFGSGKSHFMALLSLLLAGNEDACHGAAELAAGGQ